MSEKKVWATSDNGKIEYLSLTSDRLDELLDIYRKYYFSQENFCRIGGVGNNVEAIRECEQLIIDGANQGVSLIAIDKNSNKIVGATINKIVHKSTSGSLDKYISTAKQPETKRLLEVMSNSGRLVDPFSDNNVDCCYKIVNLLVLPEQSNRGIGYKLIEVSIKMATLLYKGENVKTSLDNTELPLEPRPQIVTAVFTTIKSQKIGQKLNFVIQKIFNYKELTLRGQPYSTFIEDGSETVAYAIRKLE